MKILKLLLVAITIFYFNALIAQDKSGEKTELFEKNINSELLSKESTSDFKTSSANFMSKTTDNEFSEFSLEAQSNTKTASANLSANSLSGNSIFVKDVDFTYQDSIIYAFIVFDGGTDSGLKDYLVNVDVEDATMTEIAPSGISNIYGGDFVGNYSNRVLMGISNKKLYSFNGDGSVYENGDITGLPGTGLETGLTWDVVTNQMFVSFYSFGSSTTELFTVDDNLSATFVGELGESINMISIAANSEGELYGISLDDNSLYFINKETGEATVIGPLGISLNYAQDIGFDKTTDILYGTLFNGSSSGSLYTIDVNTGAATKIGENFGDELTMCAIYSTPDFYSVTFSVSDGTAPLENANININGVDLTTDGSGIAVVELTDGVYPYVVSLEGYEDSTGNITVDGDVVSEDVVMILATNYYEVTYGVNGDNGTLIAEVDGVEITSGDEVEEGKDVVFTATADAGYKIKEWTVNSEVVTDYTESVYTVEGLSDVMSVTVEFEIITGIENILESEIVMYPNPARSSQTLMPSGLLLNGNTCRAAATELTGVHYSGRIQTVPLST
ncbi:MAG: hypothetical protein R6U11_02450 [Bacteroidales bacterium]